MRVTATIMIVLVFIIPIVCFVTEFLLARNHPKGGLIFPVIVMCMFVWLGYFALIQGAILFAIYFVMQHLKKKKLEEECSRQEEMKKMNIHDL